MKEIIIAFSFALIFTGNMNAQVTDKEDDLKTGTIKNYESKIL